MATNVDRRSSIIEWPEINLDEWLDKCPETDAEITIDESDIEAIAISRAQLMEPELSKTYKLAVDRYTEIGLPQDMMNRKLQQFDDYLTECLTVVTKVVDGEYNKFVEYKEDLMAQLAKMRKDLYLPPVDDSENYPLVQLCKRLRKKYSELNVVKEERMKRLQELREQQIKHCNVLGIKPPEFKMQTDIPTREELDSLAKTILDLAHEESKRKSKYMTLIETISRCMDQIDYLPQDEFEANVLTAKPNYTESYLSKLSAFHSRLENQYAINRTKHEQLRSKLESLYERLDIDKETRENFLSTHQACKRAVIAEMEAEIEELEEIKRKNIGLFIKNTTEELKRKYVECYVSEREQGEFLNMIERNPDKESDATLDICESELQRMKEFYETNKHIFDKVSEWNNLRNKWDELEKQKFNPGRFNNRGGALLDEEKQRKFITRKLPILEEQLMISDSNVKILGEDLADFIRRQRVPMKEIRTPCKRPAAAAGPQRLVKVSRSTPKPKDQPRSQIAIFNGSGNQSRSQTAKFNGSDFASSNSSELEFEQMTESSPARRRRM